MFLHETNSNVEAESVPKFVWQLDYVCEDWFLSIQNTKTST